MSVLDMNIYIFTPLSITGFCISTNLDLSIGMHFVEILIYFVTKNCTTNSLIVINDIIWIALFLALIEISCPLVFEVLN